MTGYMAFPSSAQGATEFQAIRTCSMERDSTTGLLSPVIGPAAGLAAARVD